MFNDPLSCTILYLNYLKNRAFDLLTYYTCRGTVRTFNLPSPDEIEISKASTSTDPHRESHSLPRKLSIPYWNLQRHRRQYGRRTRSPLLVNLWFSDLIKTALFFPFLYSCICQRTKQVEIFLFLSKPNRSIYTQPDN